MIEIFGLAVLRPWWLLGVPLALCLWLLVRQRTGFRGWRKAVDPPLLAALLARQGEAMRPALSGSLRRLAPAAAAALIALALAGPALNRDRVATWRNLDGLVLVLDASRSMAAGGNLVAARSAARALGEAAGSRPVAAVVFAGDAYLACPLTADRAELAAILGAIDGDTVPDAGSRPARALALARRALMEAGILAGSVVLFYDGGGIDGEALDGARALAAEGRTLHTVLVPPLPPFAGVVPPPDPGALAAIARSSTGGQATDLTRIGDLLAALGEDVAPRLARGGYAALAWTDLGRLLLLLAALPLLAPFRRSAT